MLYYYLLYKIPKTSILWVVDEDLYKTSLIKKIRHVNSDYERYYVIEKKFNKCEFEKMYDEPQMKRFSMFKMDNNCKIIFTTF